VKLEKNGYCSFTVSIAKGNIACIDTQLKHYIRTLKTALCTLHTVYFSDTIFKDLKQKKPIVLIEPHIRIAYSVVLISDEFW